MALVNQRGFNRRQLTETVLFDYTKHIYSDLDANNSVANKFFNISSLLGVFSCSILSADNSSVSFMNRLLLEGCK